MHSDRRYVPVLFCACVMLGACARHGPVYALSGVQLHLTAAVRAAATGAPVPDARLSIAVDSQGVLRIEKPDAAVSNPAGILEFEGIVKWCRRSWGFVEGPEPLFHAQIECDGYEPAQTVFTLEGSHRTGATYNIDMGTIHLASADIFNNATHPTVGSASIFVSDRPSQR